jgi:hypothetical protein
MHQTVEPTRSGGTSGHATADREIVISQVIEGGEQTLRHQAAYITQMVRNGGED